MTAADVFGLARSGNDEALDAAFEAVYITARFHSERAARAIEARWLWGEVWKQVAHEAGCTLPTAASMCRSAFEWMDRNIEFSTGHAVYVGTGKSPRGKSS